MRNTLDIQKVDLVSSCGLYCGVCRKYTTGKCPGCRKYEKAHWCKIRQCTIEKGYASCADCTGDGIDHCKKFNYFVYKIFSFICRSDRHACIRRIQAIGHEAFSEEMHEKKQMTIKK